MARWAQIYWPEDFQGIPRNLAEQAGFVVRTEGDHQRLTTVSQYDGTSEDLLAPGEVVSPEMDNPGVATISQWDSLPETLEDTDRRLNDRVARLLHTEEDIQPTLEEFCYAATLLFMVSNDHEFRQWFSEGLRSSLRRSLADYRICLFTTSGQVHARLAWIRALFSAAHAREWLQPGEQFEGFNAMRGLSGSAFQGSTTLMHPLLAAHSPWMFGSAASRVPNGLAVLLFGEVVPGRHSLLVPDLLTDLATNYLTGDDIIVAPATPKIELQDAVAATTWWAEGLSRLMSTLLDPTLFIRKGGWYDPADHYGHLISFDRLVSSVIATLTHAGTDEYTRRIHLFEALDLLEGMGLGDYQTNLNPTRLEAQLEQLRSSIPQGVQTVVLPRCQKAVEALTSFRQGFHPNRIGDGRLTVLGQQAISLDNAASQYLRHIRNAGHGLKQTLEEPRNLSLLSAHEGDLPAGISDVAFLHLVRLVNDPQLLELPLLGRRRLQAQ